jgi:diguanylate cyclase (GGDEF)-like protein
MINKENSYLTEQSKYLDMEFRSISIALSSTAVAILNNVINQKEIIELLDSASKTGDEVELKEYRDKLYTKLLPIYNNLKKQNIRQFHFHLPKAVSFLRFHRPERYGDSLWTVRESIKLANEEKRYISGFEEGRVFNGFRHVFPLFNRSGEFIGSVEISYSFKAVEKMAKNIYPAIYTFMLKRSIISEKVWKEERENYLLSSINNEYFFDKGSITNTNGSQMNIEKINRTLQPFVAERVSRGEQFSIPFRGSDDINYIVSFMPIKNILGDQAAYYISYKADQNFLRIESEFHKNVIFWTLFILIFTLSMVLILETKRKDNSGSQESIDYLKQIFDSQSSIMFITNGKRIIDINRAFSSFFNIETAKEFNRKYGCICDMAQQVDGDNTYIHSGLRESWKEFVSIEDRETIYKMKFNINGVDSLFYVNIDKIKLNGINHYIVSLIDFTDKERSLQEFEEKRQFDPLTKIANRTKFDTILRIEISKSLHEERPLSIIIVDIDNFREINGEFGHEAGDKILYQLAKLLQKEAGSDYSVARYGGEEFIITLPDSSLSKAKSLSKHLRERVEKYHFDIGKPITCSFGVAEFNDNDTQESLIQRADTALDMAKSRGRNRVETEED